MYLSYHNNAICIWLLCDASILHTRIEISPSLPLSLSPSLPLSLSPSFSLALRVCVCVCVCVYVYVYTGLPSANVPITAMQHAHGCRAAHVA